MDAAHEYYRAIDTGSYGALSELLAPEFVHYRPDRTIEGREAFVGFMRDERPMTDTTHEVEAVFESEGSVAVRGRLLDSDGGELFGFVDVFEFAGRDRTRIAAIVTYTR